MPGTLYVVGTPIGNLGDLSPRARDTLETVDFIAAEDTRVTLKLLNHFDIKKPLVSYFEHNRREKGELIVSRLLAGENCALVTDAGMPAISDPGEDLVDLCHLNGIPVCAVPGPTAFATALALSGLPVGRFTFEGFLSVNKPSRRAHLQSLETESRTMVFYEAPHKLIRTLHDLFEAFGDRRIALVREITKIHEEVIRTSLKEALTLYDEAHPPKGEFVLVVCGKETTKDTVTLEEAIERAKKLQSEGLAPSAAAKQAAKETGFKKGELYQALLEKGENA